jgi:periplasmic divalent cation tolerance protein
MSSASAVIVFCTCPDTAVSDTIATALVEERFAACVNVLPQIKSTYRWQGSVCRDTEQLLMIKTTHERFDELSRRVVELHPYDLPEIVAIEIADALPAYLEWLKSASLR